MRITSLILTICLLALCFTGCGGAVEKTDIAATTLPVYQFTSMLVEGTGLTVTRLVNESVSCLHDYSLNVRQVKAAEAADLIVMSGAGLEAFMEDILHGKQTVDASKDVPLLSGCEEHGDHEGHHHEIDSHIWLSPANAMVMAKNIMDGLIAAYPQHAETFQWNGVVLMTKLMILLDYGKEQLGALKNRELITFHDGFAYFAQCYELRILAAVEEEAGAETSARKLISLINLVQRRNIRAVFTESNGSDASAKVIAAETGAALYALDMAMAGDDYFAAMYHNIDTIKEALQ
jgi:ABC-type Zn uptake system ZnuABC Zn-binding protein ZnuA